MQVSYVQVTVIRIRRLVDRDRRSISFLRLMEEMAKHHEVLSRRRFVLMYGKDPHMKRIGHCDFDRLAGNGANHISPLVVLAHKKKLIRSTDRLRRYVNRYIAHLNAKPLRRLPTFEELNSCIDLLEELLKTYVLIMNGSGLIRVLPVWQYDWKQIFRVAWISDNEE